MKNKKYMIAVLTGCLLVGVYGCQKEMTDEEIKKTEVYQNLQIQYDKLQDDNDALKKKLDDVNEMSPKEVENREYLTRLTRGGVYKISYQPTDESQAAIITDDKAQLELMQIYMNRAEYDTKMEIDSLKDNYAEKYRYRLYDEDNSVYEMTVYDGDYVVFDDLKKRIFYAKGVTTFGNAFFPAKEYMPEEGSIATLYHSFLYKIEDDIVENTKARGIIEAVDKMPKQKKKKYKISPDKKKKTIDAYYYGKVYSLDFYKKAVVIREGENVLEYFKADEKNISEILKNF